MGTAATERLFFIVDAPGLLRNQDLIARSGATCLTMATAAEIANKEHSALVVDVDLTIIENVKLLKTALTGSAQHPPRVFAVDRNSRLETIYANILGATGTLRRPLTGERLFRHLAPPEEPAGLPPPGLAIRFESSIKSAAGALGGVFEAVNGTAQLDLLTIAQAGEDLVDAIGEGGFSDWLERVRQHHAGTFQHCLIVTGVLTNFARSTGMSRRDGALLTRIGLLHDVGKASIPVSLLDKPGKLTAAEMRLVQGHAAAGFDYLRAQGSVGGDILSGVRSHHEYLDGSGYPDGLRGGEISDIARIVTVCDVYGALIEQRAYKPPLPPGEAFGILEGMVSQGQLEGALVRALQRSVIAGAN